MELGDFTELAKAYINRPAYSVNIINAIISYGKIDESNACVADVGAGTGKLTKVLLEHGLRVDAVEPNSEMLREGKEYTKGYVVNWSLGSGEETGLDSEHYDWVTMGSSFHWTDPVKSLPEFARILKSGGIFTAIWNPRNISSSEFHTNIENKIYEIAPNIKRFSSGGKTYTKNWEEIIISTGDFKDVILMEMSHKEIMSPDRYLGAWRSVNDIRSQAGKENWGRIYEMIKNEVSGLSEIIVPYTMRAWTGIKK